MTQTIRIVAACMASLLAISSGPTLRAADHLEAPLVRLDGRTDINDVYAFQSPANPDNTVLIMTVNPFAGILSPMTLHPDANYDFKIDTNGDAIEDMKLSLTFSMPNAQGFQRVLLRKVTATGRRGGIALARGFTGQTVPVRGGGMLRVDLFDDPFFFDLDGLNAGLNFTGNDTFAGANVTCLVLEVPSTLFGTSSFDLWGTTEIFGQQIDRMGRPAINTVLVPTGLKDAFNLGIPATDLTNFFNVFVNTLLALGNDQARAEAVAGILLPDVLDFDTTSAEGFLNGRRLEDDVIDTELVIVTDGAVTTDMVDSNDAEFLDVFPYLAPPQPLP